MKPITLYPEQTYTIDGVTVTGKEILETMIDNVILKEDLNKATQ